MASIEIESLALRRGEFQLQIPQLRVEAGTVLGLVGRNGAGKSTLLALLAGLLEPDRGGVRVLGLSPTGDAVALRRRLSWMSDDMPVLPLPLAAHARFLSGFYPSWDPALVEGLFRRVELDPRKNLQRMSKGEATRARLALAVGAAPLVLFAGRAGGHASGVSVLLGMVLALPVSLGGDGAQLGRGGIPWPALPVSLPGAWRRVVLVGWGLGLLLGLPQALLYGFSPQPLLAPLGLAIAMLPARTWGRPRRIAAFVLGLFWLSELFFPVLEPSPPWVAALGPLTLLLAFAPHGRSQP